MNLHQYLLTIKSNKAINLRRFISLLPEQYQLERWRKIFTSVKTTAKDKYQLQVIDGTIFEQLIEASKSCDSREGAAEQGDSHKVNTSISYLLIFDNVSCEYINHSASNTNFEKLPQVVVCHSTGITMDFKPQKTLVIIENQENFFRYQEFAPQFITMHPGLTQGVLSKVDIAFGQGNNATNKLNAEFYTQYQQVLCCFDYDLGGLTMYSSLIKLTKAQVHFIQPSKQQLTCYNFIKKHFKKSPEKAEHWRKAIKLAEQLGFSDLAQAFSLSRKFMEQEVLLTSSEITPSEK